MKLRGIYIVLIVILAIATLIITSSDSIVPYSRDTLFSHMYKYEGMENLPKPLTSEEFNAAMSSLNKNKSSSKNGFTNESDDSAKMVDDSAKMVEGFALQPSPFGDSLSIDRFSSTPSGPQCFGRSSGYSNSLGPLCLSKEDERLLSTRGGNISGNDSIIGH